MSNLLCSLASPGKRYLGQFIDFAIAWLIFLFFIVSLKPFITQQHDIDIIALIFSGLYYVFCDALPRGKSVGKLFLKMSVIDKDNGQYCSLWQSFVRNVLNPIIGIVDGLFILSKKRQRLGDMAANTIVINL
ncbi:RDD family protein [Vibrio sp. SM6]|uniref:RDD family protein n=2 Tax=Vibrio agarilyticus TaxID=2726741 RepID=A0A7X8YHB0_9VIBR|nr:RDD family protein [Vibrio agarilyticus]NLS13271.1 RDD family protein [Vibrio agarilyticus]